MDATSASSYARCVNRVRPLFVTMDPGDRERLVDRAAAEAGGELGRVVSVAEYVREALRFAAENRKTICIRLGRTR